MTPEELLVYRIGDLDARRKTLIRQLYRACRENGAVITPETRGQLRQRFGILRGQLANTQRLLEEHRIALRGTKVL